jgi:hypothetical protein
MYIARWYFKAEPPPALPELTRRAWSTPAPPSIEAGGDAAAKGERPTAPYGEVVVNGEVAKGDAPKGEAEIMPRAIGELPGGPIASYRGLPQE